LHEIDQAPAHHAVDGGNGTLLDDLLQCATLLIIENEASSRRLAVQEPRRALDVEAQHPVPHGLQADAANPGRISARPTLVNRSQRQKPPDLVGITRPLGQPAKTGGVEVRAKGNNRRGAILKPACANPLDRTAAPWRVWRAAAGR